MSRGIYNSMHSRTTGFVIGTRCVSVSETWTTVLNVWLESSVRASRRRSPFHRFLHARIRARRHLHRPARPRHHPLHLHRRHRPLRFMLTCARSRCMHSWRGGAMPPELPRRCTSCVRLWRCSLDATWWVPSQHGRARVGLRRRSHTRWAS